MLNPWKDLKTGDFIRIYWPVDELFTIGVYKGFTEGGKKLLIEETRIINKEGRILLFKRIQYWNSSELKGNIARIDV